MLIQFKSQSLLQHLRDGWEASSLLKQHFIIPVPAQMRSPGEDWYRGTADAIYQNINLIEQADPHFVVIFGADHIYRMNIREMLEFHMHKRAQATIAAIPVAKEQAGEFGVIEAAADGTVIGFHEKSAGCAHHARRSGARVRVHGKLHFLDQPAAARVVRGRAESSDSSHDFGRDILPAWWAAPTCSPTIFRPTGSPAIRRRRNPTGATSGPSTPITTPTWICAR